MSAAGGGGSAGGVGQVEIKGVWTKQQKDKLFTQLDRMENTLGDFRTQSMIILRKILSQKQLKKEDIMDLVEIKERDLEFYDAMVKILGLTGKITSDEFFEKLEDYIDMKQESIDGLIHRINVLLESKEKKEPSKYYDEEDDD